MPLYREWASDPYSLAAIWKIEEPESFFAEQTGLQPAIRNEKRRMEHLAGRFLLKYLEQDFPLLHIRPDQNDKPRIADNRYYFSISHSWPYVAVIVSPYVEAGIDIQCWHPRMELLQAKFLSPEEQSLFKNDAKMITMAWCAKEAAYKWQGLRGVEFIDHLPISNLSTHPGKYYMSIFLQLNVPKIVVLLESLIEQDFACSYVINQANESLL